MKAPGLRFYIMFMIACVASGALGATIVGMAAGGVYGILDVIICSAIGALPGAFTGIIGTVTHLYLTSGGRGFARTYLPVFATIIIAGAFGAVSLFLYVVSILSSIGD
jgi:hypothetical protein